MEEWKELQIDNLPPDILTGGYEFERWDVNNCLTRESEGWEVNKTSRSGIIHLLVQGRKYRYRKPEPKQPTHEEIMTKWWLSSSLWVKVMSYDRDEKKYETPSNYEYYDWFIGRESADIPPEA